MAGAGLPFVLDGSDTKIFVWPHQYEEVQQALIDSERKLYSSHVIVAASILPHLEAAIAYTSEGAGTSKRWNG